MREVYFAAYERCAAGWTTLREAACLAPGEVPAPPGTGWVGAGNGFAAHGETLAARLGGALAQVIADLRPGAYDIARLAAPRFACGEGVDAAFDCLAGEHTARTLRCLADNGRIILFGSASGQPARFDFNALYSRGLSAHGLWLSKLSANHALIRQALASMMPYIREGKLRPVVGAKFPISAAEEALRLLLERKNFGKVILTA